ncbi:Trp biosynthesis-associated membrane protein [Pseudarthrobacter sp. So.54]
MVGAAAVVIADPVAAAQGSIAAATGITGSDVQVDVTAFPALAVAAGSLLGLSALLVIPAGRHWKSRTKYDTAAAGSAAGGPASRPDRRTRSTAGTGCPAETIPPEPMPRA